MFVHLAVLPFFDFDSEKDQIDLLRLQPFSQWISVIAPVGEQPPDALARPTAGGVGNIYVLKGGFLQLDIRRRRRRKSASKWNTFAVNHRHPLCSFAAFGFTVNGAPFFRSEAQLSPSAKVSSKFKYGFSSNSEAHPRCITRHPNPSIA